MFLKEKQEEIVCVLFLFLFFSLSLFFFFRTQTIEFVSDIVVVVVFFLKQQQQQYGQTECKKMSTLYEGTNDYFVLYKNKGRIIKKWGLSLLPVVGKLVTVKLLYTSLNWFGLTLVLSTHDHS